MTPLALVLALCALAAPLHAAYVPDTRVLHKSLPAPCAAVGDLAPGKQESVAHAPTTHDENETRVKPEDIPVQVVIEDQPSENTNEVGDKAVERPAIDLHNPGPPQRQEHETQNPERHLDEQLKVTTIKESIERAQNLLRENIQDISENIQNWILKNDDQNKVEKNIQNLRETFTSQFQKLNDTIQALIKPEEPKPVEVKGEESQRKYDEIQSHLRVLEDDFNNDVETLTAGVELVASLRSSADEDVVKDEAPQETADLPSSPSPPAKPTEPVPAPAQNFIVQTMNAIRDRVTENMNNIQYILTGQGPQSSSPPAGAQADTPATSTPIFPMLPNFTTIFQNNPFSNFTNIFQNNPFPNITNTLQNFNPLGNRPNFTNFIQNFNPGNIFSNFGQTTAKPASASVSPVAEKPVESSPDAAVDKPADVPLPAPAAEQPVPADPQPGPIRQFLSHIPVVQRIQNTITNRDTPRLPIEKSNDDQSKGGWYGPPIKPSHSGDNIDSGVSEKKSVEVKEPIKEDPIKEEPIKEVPIKEVPIKEVPIKEVPIKEETIKKETIKEESMIKENIEVKPESIPEKTE